MAANLGQNESPQVISWEKSTFISLQFLRAQFGLVSVGPEVAARNTPVIFDGRRWEFLNGGDQVRLPDGQIQGLAHPLLVVEGTLYLHSKDLANLFAINGSLESVQLGSKSVKTIPRSIVSRYKTHTVGSLTVTNRFIKLRKTVDGALALEKASPPAHLPAGGIFVNRRRVILDGQPHWVITDCGPNPVSYLVLESHLGGNFEEINHESTAWNQRMKWFRQAATNTAGLNRSENPVLANQAALTMDLCWSIRPMEREFLTNLEQTALVDRPIAVTPFLSGRWIEQHPTEMEELMELQKNPRWKVTWGLHSWAHPKSGNFMNDFEPATLENDTLHLEKMMLEWGIVPTVYYRFPGLIHDQKRLDAVLDLGLLPIDADAWVAVQQERHPHGGPIRDGSIVLVHGNGNEPRGISALQSWMGRNPGWAWVDISRFLPQ